MGLIGTTAEEISVAAQTGEKPRGFVIICLKCGWKNVTIHAERNYANWDDYSAKILCNNKNCLQEFRQDPEWIDKVWNGN